MGPYNFDDFYHNFIMYPVLSDQCDPLCGARMDIKHRYNKYRS